MDIILYFMTDKEKVYNSETYEVSRKPKFGYVT